MKTGIPSHDGHQRKQNKGRSKPDNSGWFGNPVSLIAMCVTVLALVTAVIFNFHDSETADTGDYASLRIPGDITPGPASGTTTVADQSLASNGDESEPQTIAGSAANPFQNIGLLQPSPAAVADDHNAAKAQADAPEAPTIAGQFGRSFLGFRNPARKLDGELCKWCRHVCSIQRHGRVGRRRRCRRNRTPVGLPDCGTRDDGRPASRWQVSRSPRL